MGCAESNNKCSCKKLEQFLYVALDYQGNIVVISDYANYPNVEVDPTDQQITFDEPDVKDFIKPETELIFQNGIHKIIR